VTGERQQFYEHWRKIPTDFYSHDTFPCELLLGVGVPFRPDSTLENRILVTKSYDDMFHRISDLRKNDKGRHRGVVLTGQPGIGASL